VRPTDVQVEQLARWMFDQHCLNPRSGGLRFTWDALPPGAADDMRHVARALLERPPAVLTGAVAGEAVAGRGDYCPTAGPDARP
jgi:hypothetical protein